MRPQVIESDIISGEYWGTDYTSSQCDSDATSSVIVIDNRDAHLHNLAVQLLECNKEFAEAFLKLAHQDALEHGPDAVSNVYEHIDLYVLSARTGIANG